MNVLESSTKTSKTLDQKLAKSETKYFRAPSRGWMQNGSQSFAPSWEQEEVHLQIFIRGGYNEFEFTTIDDLPFFNSQVEVFTK